jgi:surface protein
MKSLLKDNNLNNLNTIIEGMSFINTNFSDLYLGDFSINFEKTYSINEIEKYEPFLCYDSLNSLFAGCSSLRFLPDISKWNLENVRCINNLFLGCTSLIRLPDISKWETKNIKYMNSLFKNC